MKTISVNCSKQYNVHIGKKALDLLPTLLGTFSIGKNIFLITDDIVEKRYANKLIDLIPDSYRTVKYVLPNGESSKNSDNLLSILNTLANNSFKRNDTIIALGGGVVGDISGLSASLYMRGINLIQIPTTLLAMVDASIGGKTAIDLQKGKNLVGTFYQPLTVICDTEIIEELPEDIFKEGMAEVIKYNIIDRCQIIRYIEEGTFMDHLEEIIESCISIKAKVVSQDEYESKGLRKVLNAEHTFAHSLENMSNYHISHGKAVGTGLVYESQLAKYLGLCDEATCKRIKEALIKYDLLIDFDYLLTDLVDHMKLDKKNDSNLISFILPTELGACKEVKLSLEETKEAFLKIGVIK